MAPNMLPIYTCHWYQITLSCLPLPSPLYSHASSCSSSRSSTRACYWYVFMYLRSNATEVPDLLHLVMVLSNRPCWGRKNSIPSHSFGKSLPAVHFALHVRHWYYSTSLHLRKLDTCLLFWLMWYSFCTHDLSLSHSWEWDHAAHVDIQSSPVISSIPFPRAPTPHTLKFINNPLRDMESKHF